MIRVHRFTIVVFIFTVLSLFALISMIRRKNHEIKEAKLEMKIHTLENQIKQAEIKSKLILSDFYVLQERREILDSLHQTNIKNRNNEKIKLLQSACDSTIKRIVLDHIGAK